MTSQPLVVGAIIVDSLSAPTQVLAARRTTPPALAGKWEFPGGKVEPGEAARDALRRELLEELSIDVVLGDELKHPIEQLWPASGGYSMRLFWVEFMSGATLNLTGSHDECRWLPLWELDSVDWLASDVAVLPHLSGRSAS